MEFGHIQLSTRHGREGNLAGRPRDRRSHTTWSVVSRAAVVPARLAIVTYNGNCQTSTTGLWRLMAAVKPVRQDLRTHIHVHGASQKVRTLRTVFISTCATETGCTYALHQLNSSLPRLNGRPLWVHLSLHILLTRRLTQTRLNNDKIMIISDNNLTRRHIIGA